MTTSRKPSLEAKKDEEIVAETTEQLATTSLEDSKPVVAPTEETSGEVIVHDYADTKEVAPTAAAPETAETTPEAAPVATEVAKEEAAVEASVTPETEATPTVTATPVEETPAVTVTPVDETPAATVTSHSLFTQRIPSPTPAPVADYESPRP